ncbi:MAG TPA: cell division protein FtsZ, partial [Prosthecobacter sp.]|nr:cell division protein FtsZ [Prosthecobacter sp.]
MVEYDRTQSPEGAENSAPRICIVGVGGAGSNVVDRITLDRIVDATLVCAHTDVRVLGHSMAPLKIQLGAELMKGIGAGGDPDLGREAALFSREQVRQAIEGHDIIFISAGLGGGTGSGAAPVIAEIAKNTGALVLVVATMPFSFEGRRRLAQAEEALELLQKRADALVLFENNRMGELILPKDGIQKAFNQADQLIAQSLRAVSTITTTPGLVKLGLDDLTSALANANGRCLFGFGEARGQNRGTEALKKALKSPLIDSGRLLHQTKNLLVHVAGGESLTLVEVEGVMKQLGRHVPDQTHILFGLGVDAKLGDSIAVTLISSLGLNQLNAHATAAPPSEMLQPRAEAPAPAPKREAPPVKKAPSPYAPPVEASADLLFKSEEIASMSAEEAPSLSNAHVHEEAPEVEEQPVPVFPATGSNTQ